MYKNPYPDEFKQEVANHYRQYGLTKTKNKYQLSVQSVLAWSNEEKHNRCIQQQRDFYNKHKDKKIYKEKISKRNKNHYQNNKDQYKKSSHQYYLDHKDEVKCKNKRWYKRNKIKARSYYRERQRRLYRTDPIYRLKSQLKGRLNAAIRCQNGLKSAHTIELLGCNIDVLKPYLESKFQQGMTWENYGKWHVDHVIPCCKFDLTKSEEQRKCFHYTNLQPLWAIDNLQKGTSV